MRLIDDKNVQTLISLVKIGLWRTTEEPWCCEGIDWNMVLRLAKEQSVVGLAFSGLERAPIVQMPMSVKLQWIGIVRIIEHNNLVMNDFIAGLFRMLQKEGVIAFLVKGQGIAQCYENSLCRSSGDVDLLLDAENYEKAKLILKPLAMDTHKEHLYLKHLGMILPENFVVELHGTLRSRLTKKIDYAIDSFQEIIFTTQKNRLWENGSCSIQLPAVDEDLIFVFTHILHHFFIEGVGLRQICDWCRLTWTYRDTIDVSLLEKRLRDMRLITEWKAFSSLAVKWLGMPSESMPLYEKNKKWEKKSDRIMELVLEMGNLGHNREKGVRSGFWGKTKTLFRRTGDSIKFARIFPLDAWRIWLNMIVSAAKER